MRFDWYQVSVEDKPLTVIDTIAKLGDEVRPADGMAKCYHYQQGWAIHSNTRGILAHVFAGGNGPNAHAFASSTATDAFVDLVRTQWPERHLVTRMDAAQDFNEERCYDRLRRVTRKVAKRHRLSFPQYADVLNPAAGRTQYVGSPKSDYRCRLYEKGWEEVGKVVNCLKVDPGSAKDFQTIYNELTGEFIRPQDWTRLELQVRPRQEDARRLAATLTPEQAWGCTDWARELAQESMALELQKIVMRTRKMSKDDEAMRWMCQHYGAMLYRLKGDLGDWSCVGMQIGEVLKELSASKA